MKIHDETPFLFEDEDEAAAGPTPAEPGITHANPNSTTQARETARPDAAEESGPPPLTPDSEWVEVPQALFLSWSPAMRAAYCAARDEDAAICGIDGPAMTMFYLERAEAYRCLAKS